ncbi:cation-translocating P-type ATPase [Paenibacillus sp. HB172176]|uniref:heavy metal translocating P-type ATPase n=1 Tax=Paenibacillus sp. HB172176 TaxID=2493690 RepID=UPI00143879D1|nr:cation-translocating P-type ATPase [Paenibacillus sp. HB172176]
MNEYRVQGLSCGGCALRLQQEIERLQHGEDAKLSFASGKLTVSSEISMDAVRKILRSDGASIIEPQAGEYGRSERHHHDGAEGHSHDHAHDHAHGHAHAHGSGMFGGALRTVAVAAILYAAALVADSYANQIYAVLLYAAAAIISGYTTFAKGLKNLLRLRFTMDTLMTIALVGAAAIGEWKEAAFVAILFGLNEYLEGLGMERARKSMDALLKATPKNALKLDNGRELMIPIDELRVGDTVRVKAGEMIPSDGIITEGSSEVNEAAITGESLPLDKQAGNEVYGGSINGSGMLHIRIEKAYVDSSLANILHLVEEAQETKTPTELFINRFAAYYTPGIMILAALVAAIPPLLFGKDWIASLYEGLSVLIVGCPCALILASPVAIVSGIARAARHGILVKGGVFLEQLGKLDTIAFDKTGTLTKGEPHVARTVEWDDQLLRIAGAIEQASSHPLAKAVMREVEARKTEIPAPQEIKTKAGSGVEASIDGSIYYLGNEKAMSHLQWTEEQLSAMEALKSEGLTLVIVADEHKALGLFGIQDEIRPESAGMIRSLHALGIKRTVMLTGDHERTAAKVAGEVGVTSYESSLLPQDKVERVKELGDKAAMIGDGMNDAPALAAASLGIAMGKGTASAVETADIVLMQDHIGKLPEAISIAKKVNRVIRINIGAALGLKLIALLLTIPGWLTLWIAVLSDMGATILVTLASLTLLIERRK